MTGERTSETLPGAGPAERLQHVIQGEFAVVDRPGIVLTTLLGSCVAVCLFDPMARVGGMNHFLLPGEDQAGAQTVKYGVNAMELLINGLVGVGAARNRLVAKAFGGGRVVASLGTIGEKNIEFARRFLDTEKIPCLSESLGGTKARRIRFWPTTGRATQIFLDSSPAEIATREREAVKQSVKPAAPSVELF